MTNKGNKAIIIPIVIAGLIVIIFVLRLILLSQYTKALPDVKAHNTMTETVIEQIEGQRTIAKRKPSARNLGKLGKVYHANALYEEAAKCYNLAIRRDDEAWIWKYYLGYLYLEMGQSDKVLEQFGKVLELNSNAYHAAYYAGEASINLGRIDQAEHYFEMIKDVKKVKLEDQSSGREDHFALGVYASYQLSDVYMNSGRAELAEKTLNEIINAHRDFGPAYRLLGNIHRIRDDMAKAEQIGAIANDLTVYSQPVDTLIDELSLLSRSESYLLKMIDEAIKYVYSAWAFQLVDNAVEHMPWSKYLLSKSIKVCLWLEKETQAATYASDHLDFSRNDYAEMYEIGMLFYKNEHFNISTRYFEQALQLKPDDYDLMGWLARSLWHEGDQQKALDQLNEIILAHPDNYEVLAEVTEIMVFDLGEHTKSRQYYSVLNFIIPSNPRVLKITAWKAEQDGDIQDAILKYEASYQGNPGDLTTVQNLGALLTDQRMWERAIRHYNSASAIHPGEPSIMERLGTLLIVCPEPSLRNIPEGRNYLERAFINLSSDPKIKIQAGRNLALAYAMLGDKQNTMSVINMTIKIARLANYSEELIAELVSMMKQLELMSESTVVLTE